jgi:hypothetical protein
VKYRWEVQTREGMVQQLASNILPHGYWFYVTGVVPWHKNPVNVDQKLIWKYGAALSRQQRARRKAQGLANVHYLRWGRFWVLLATHGEHEFFAAEAVAMRDIRKVPLRIDSYTLTLRRGAYRHERDAAGHCLPDGRLHVRVRIARDVYRDLIAWYEQHACHKTVDEISRQLWNLPFEPYAPIRRQFLNLLRIINKHRRTAGLPAVPPDCLRLRRKIVKVFGDANEERGGQEAQGD